MTIYYDGAILDDGSDFNDVFNSLKSGAFVCCISHNKTYHRTTIKLEDVGFEIRDMILWINDENSIPITLARKPLSEKTIVDNVLKHGTGGINIDETRIPINKDVDDGRLGGGSWNPSRVDNSRTYDGGWVSKIITSSDLGRFPANLIHDGSDEVEKLFPDVKSGGSRKSGKNKLTSNITFNASNEVVTNNKINPSGGSASRFFKTLKDRNELIEYLSVLITPKEGKLYSGI